MGNSANSKTTKVLPDFEKDGGIYLKPNKDWYHPGEQFDGVIYLNLLTSYPGDSIYLILKGVEKYMYAFTQTNDENSDMHILHKDKKILMNTKIPVYKNDLERFQPGQYAFPISFLIPSNISSSFYQEGESWVASTEYKVKAILNTSDPRVPKLCYKENMLILGQMKTENAPLQRQEIANLKICCCRYGYSTISLSLEKDALMPGETTNLVFSMDNTRGKLSFANTKCRLFQSITLGDNKHKFSNTVVAVDLPGFKAGSSLFDQRTQITVPPYNAINHKNKRIPYKQLRFEDVERMKFTPNDLVPTTVGTLVKTQFYLAVKSTYEGCCCFFLFSDPTVQIPVQIYIPSITLPSNVQAPLGWNPQIMPTANLALDLAPQNNSSKGEGGENPYDLQQHQQDTQLISKMQIGDNLMRP